jgi:hypothetical protein
VSLALIDVIDLEVAGADGYDLRLALGDESQLEAGETRERYAESIVGAEGFNFCGLGAFAIGAFGTGDDGDVTVGENSVYVVEENLDAKSAVGCGESFSGHLEMIRGERQWIQTLAG